MDTSKPQSAKQLKEHLQHNQEPFSLQSYLIKRSYMFKNSSSDSSNIQHLYSAKDLKWSIKYDLHKIRKRLLHASGILRSLLYKFIPTEDNQELSNEEHNSDLYYVHEYLTAHTQKITHSPSIQLLKPNFSRNYDIFGRNKQLDHCQLQISFYFSKWIDYSQRIWCLFHIKVNKHLIYLLNYLLTLSIFLMLFVIFKEEAMCVMLSSIVG